ncbi:MAG: peptide-methionine (R)-S-oxide reductase MsrB [Pseudomonadota bacterium]
MTKSILSRRAFLVAGGASALGTAAVLRGGAPPADPPLRETDSFTLATNGEAPINAPGFPDWTEEQWRALDAGAWRERLSAEAYEVLRREGTERAFTSPLNNEKRDGWYACAGCGYVLFSSEDKYDSGTGWPSFIRPISDDRIGTKPDYKLIRRRTEYHCARCGGHHGHVFNDGPPPTGQRWCNNGVALTFVPKADLA